jgi:hypothetical protein
MQIVAVSVRQHSQPDGVKPKMRGCKLRSGVHWQGVLNQKGFNKGYAYL